MLKERKGYSNLRIGRTSLTGHAYHVTFSTNQRQPIFKNLRHARTIIQAMQGIDHSNATLTFAFVVMPDHIHWLFQLRNGQISQTISKAKSEFSRKSGLKIWNQGFYDHGIRSDEMLIEVARYIVANPIRANLVKKIGDYPHWDSIWL